MEENSDNKTSEHLSKARDYTILILKKGPKYQEDAENGKPIVWEHGKRNMSLRQDGVLAVVCPITDPSEYAGIGVFSCSVEEARRVMDDDPAIKAGVLTYSVHSGKGFPGDALPS
jgi:hypothetical protein